MSIAISPMNRQLLVEVPERSPGTVRRLALELDCGRIYRVMVDSPSTRLALLTHLNTIVSAAVVPADGGLISNLRVWENMVLPRAWRNVASYAELEQRARAILGELGFKGETFSRLCASAPERLTRFELRLVAFVRAMLAEPEVIAYDCLFDGLTRAQIEQALAFDRVFHLHFPFRTSIYIDSDVSSLPEVGAHEVAALE